MNGEAPDALAGATFLVTAFTLAGFCQTLWLAAPVSRRFALPLDGGRTVRGRRLLGANKTIRGVMVMVPATGASFAILSALVGSSSSSSTGLDGLWMLPPYGYGLLGLWAGLGFMLGELPNSFVKRQLDIAPGAAGHGRVARPLFFVLDRIDSIAGLLVALSVVVPVSWRLSVYVVAIGSLVHGTFSVLLFHLGVKARAA